MSWNGLAATSISRGGTSRNIASGKPIRTSCRAGVVGVDDPPLEVSLAGGSAAGAPGATPNPTTATRPAASTQTRATTTPLGSNEGDIDRKIDLLRLATAANNSSKYKSWVGGSRAAA